MFQLHICKSNPHHLDEIQTWFRKYDESEDRRSPRVFLMLWNPLRLRQSICCKNIALPFSYSACSTDMGAISSIKGLPFLMSLNKS
jgi:hypothetical protein